MMGISKKSLMSWSESLILCRRGSGEGQWRENRFFGGDERLQQLSAVRDLPEWAALVVDFELFSSGSKGGALALGSVDGLPDAVFCPISSRGFDGSVIIETSQGGR
jgi:hypothetical protein